MKHAKSIVLLLVNLSLFQQVLYAQIKIEIANKNSLARLSRNEPRYSKAEKKIALTFYNALLTKNMDSLKFVENYYLDVYRSEDFIDIKHYSSMYWLIKCITADTEDLKKELDDPLSEDLFYFFTDNNFERLKNYLILLYKIKNYKPTSELYSKTFYKQFLTIHAPIREEWEKTSELLNYLPLKKGDKVIDVGCGFGYNSIKLSKIVGDAGKVYATDIDSQYIDHLKQIIGKSKIKNIFPVLTDPNYIGIKDSVDAVLMCVMYHHFYGRISDNDRTKWFNSMKQALKIGGYLLIEDNLIINNRELDNFGDDKRLIIAQLAYWGFTYFDYKEFSEQRYVMIFKQTNEKVKEQTLYADEKSANGSFLLNIASEKSIFYYPWVSTDHFTQNGKMAAKLAYVFFDTGNIDSAKKAIDMYDSIIPAENFGGEYGAIQWLCKVKSSSSEKRNIILKNDPLSNSFYNTMTKNNDSLIKYYLSHKYKLFDEDSLVVNSSAQTRIEIDREDMSLLGDYILAMNPNPEKSDFIIQSLKLHKGQTIADLGGNTAYFINKFSQIVGDTGKVHEIEFINRKNEALRNYIREQSIENIEELNKVVDSFSLKKKADIIFIYSFYNKIYGVFTKSERDKLAKSIIENMSTNGKLIIIENGPVDEKTSPYNESYLIKELIEYQLAFYGFELTNDVQITPQQYMLTFELKRN